MAEFRSIFVGWREQAFNSGTSIDSIISEAKENFVHEKRINFPIRLTDNGFSFVIEYDYTADDEEFVLENQDEDEDDIAKNAHSDEDEDEDNYNQWDDDEDDVAEYLSYRDTDFENQIKSITFSGNQVLDSIEYYYRNIISIDEDTKFQKILLDFSKKYGGPFYQDIEDENGNTIGRYLDFDIILHDLDFQFLTLLKNPIKDFFEKLKKQGKNEIVEHNRSDNPYVIVYAINGNVAREVVEKYLQKEYDDDSYMVSSGKELEEGGKFKVKYTFF